MLCELKNLKRKPVDRPAVFWAVFTACKAEVTCVMHEAPPYGTTVFTADGPFPSRKPIQPSIKKKTTNRYHRICPCGRQSQAIPIAWQFLRLFLQFMFLHKAVNRNSLFKYATMLPNLSCYVSLQRQFRQNVEQKQLLRMIKNARRPLSLTCRLV